MTCLHWAAFNGDPILVTMLLDKGAKQEPNGHGITPVDMAGFCDHSIVVREFCKNLCNRIDIEKKAPAAWKQENSIIGDQEEGNKAGTTQIVPVNTDGYATGDVGEILGNSENVTGTGDKIKIECAKVKKLELDDQEKIDLRVFYWAAFHGFKNTVKYMIEGRRWSPFIKSYKNRSVVSGAIWGGQVDIVRLMLGNYSYINVHTHMLIDFAKTVYNKDSADNNCLHYCYMKDLPEVRQILRDNGLFQERSQRLNRRGQFPTKLRHFIKAEDSNDETEEEDYGCYDAQELKNNAREMDMGGLGLSISGTAINTDNKAIMQEEPIILQEMLAGKKDFDLTDKKDIYRLKFNKELTKKQKMAHYQSPDYCIITRADTLQVLRLELDALVSRDGIYYSIYDKID